jgi:hypothetical protein
MGVAEVITLSVPPAPLAWSPGDNTEYSVVVVYAVLAGAGFAIVLVLGLLAFWLDRRARRVRRLQRTPVPRPRMPAAAASAAADGGEAAAAAAPPLQTGRFQATIDLEKRLGNGNGNGHAPARVSDDPSGEYALLRAAAARAQTVAAQARHTLVEAANTLDTAERVYDEARRARAEQVAASAADKQSEATELRARHQYHFALAQARIAKQAEYVADTAVRALSAETAAAAAELAAEHGNGNGKARRRRPATGASGAAR